MSKNRSQQFSLAAKKGISCSVSVLLTQDQSERQKDLIEIEDVEDKTAFRVSECVAPRKQMMMSQRQAENNSYSRLMIGGKGSRRRASTAMDASKSSSSKVPSKKAIKCKYEFEQLSVDHLKQRNRNIEINSRPKLRPFEPQIQKRILKKPHEYTCRKCSKTFPTFLALGGHRSCHGEDKNTKAVEPSIGAIQRKKNATPSVKVEETRESGEHASLHICNLYYKRFPTDQALGGHKKCHWATVRSAKARARCGGKGEDHTSQTTTALTIVQLPLQEGATDH
ncbi:zinc finger protein AZF2-like [Juglans microcarpa x Juglans regia]|uniref:zinc finger protein AZF2-like n=1 Tax=Juglans microcarpa x Juglans regia TaxID=2249226 RepID=UPI001B7E4154|nr:zinc finger protein AZF2-like [Juglans microcarpa x Juglans regia]